MVVQDAQYELENKGGYKRVLNRLGKFIDFKSAGHKVHQHIKSMGSKQNGKAEPLK